jgi:hypothetical protein
VFAGGPKLGPKVKLFGRKNLDKARDSSLLFHVTGEDKVWPHSIEFQMIDGGTGDIILVGGDT